MAVTSANPDDLGHFVTDAGRRRDALEDRLGELTSLQRAVLAASPDFGVSSTLLSGIGQAFQGFRQNERFVHTVRTELLHADRDPRTGVASISDASVGAALRSAGVEQKPPPVEVEPGMLLGIPPTSGFVDDPVCAANGNFVEVERDLAFPGWSAVLDVVRVHNSLAVGSVGAFGPGWTSVLDLRIDHVPGGVVRARLADGAVVPFSGDGPELRAAGARPLRVTVLDDGWLLHEGHTKTWRFDGEGRFTGGEAGPARLVVARDDADRIVGLTESRSGRAVRFEWQTGRVVAVTSSDGRTVTYDYDDTGALVRVDRPSGVVTYGVADGRVVAVTDADGVVLVRNTYDDEGRVLEQTNELGRTTRYSYSELGTTLVADTIGGPRNALTHDRRGNLTSMVDGTGRAMRLTYDDAGRATSVRDRTGATTRHTYDERGNLVARLDPDGLGATWTWDDADRLVAETGRSGGTTTYRYEGDDRRPSAVTAPDGGTTTIVVSADGVPVEVTDPDGVVTSFEWDDDGQLVAIIDGLGHRSTFAFDDAGALVAVTDASGVATELHRDGAGRVVGSIVADATCRYRYTDAGRPIAGHDGEGVAWSAAYGDHGRAVAFADGEGSTVGFEWDRFGNLEVVVAPDGERYVHEHDAAGRLVAATDPQGATGRRELDGEGRVVAVRDAAGRTWRRELDVLGRTIRSVAPDGATTTYGHHPDGTVREVVHPDGTRVTTEVDGAGRVVAITDAAGGRFELAYTAAGRLRERRSPSGRVQSFAYDAAGRLVSSTAAGGAPSALTLDPRGRILAEESPAGRVSYDYNSSGELIGVTSPTAARAVTRDRAGRVTAVTDGDEQRSTFEWNGRGTLSSATDAAGLASTFDRDLRGRIRTTTSAAGDVTSFDYDPTGFLRALTDATGTHTRLLDATGRITGVRGPDGTGVDRVVDDAGRVVGITGTDGADLGRFAYDAAGRLTSATRDGASNRYRWSSTRRLVGVDGPVASLGIEHDEDGAVAGWTGPDGARVRVERTADGEVAALVDDAAGRVVPPPARAARRRDRAGRLTGSPTGDVHRYDAAGRLVETVDRHGRRWSFAYGDDGLLAGEDGPLGARTYHRGVLGRLERLEVADGTTTTFTYDGAGRRVAAVRSDGSERRWLWDGLGLLVAIDDVDPDGTRRRVDIALDGHGRPYRVGETPVVWDDVRTGLPLAVGGDRLLHVGGRTAVAPAAATTWLEPPADPWGTDGEGTPHVGFRAALVVDDLVWMGDRVYDASTREFLSPDPLLTVPGRPAFSSAYAYGFLDPVNFLDPTGRRPISQAEFDALRQREEQGRFGQAWEAIQNDPWGTLAMVGVVAVGVGLLFVPGGQAFGAGILIGAAASAGVGVATGTFSPTDVAVSGVLGAIPGGNSYKAAIATGAALGAGQEIGMEVLRGESINWDMVAIQAATGGVTGGISHGISGARPTVEAPAAPTVHTRPAIEAPPARPALPAGAMPRRPTFVVDPHGVTTVVPPGGSFVTEVHAPHPVKPGAAVDVWHDFLGDGPYSNTHPRLGTPDANRIVSADGTRSVRYGNHEMLAPPGDHHFHLETWTYDPTNDLTWVDNLVIHVPL